MGMINIETAGSFPHRRKSFSALDHGHARAVADAIKWLSEEVLPEAIKQDHIIHADQAKPKKGFGKD